MKTPGFEVLLLNAMGNAAGTLALQEMGGIVQCVPADPKPLVEQGILANAHALGVRLPAIVDEELLCRMPALRVIATAAAGLNNIDVKTASALGIPVVNCAGAGTQSVAEHAVGMMLALSKRLLASDRALRTQGWHCREKLVRLDQASELGDRVVGIVGLGAIGRRIARICSMGFGMKAIAYSPTTAQEIFAASQVERYDDVTDLCAAADFVVVAAPAIPATHRLIGHAQLSAMSKDSFLINVSRGSVVHEAELVRALSEGTIAGAGLDVFEDEPLAHTSELFNLDNVIVTPHIAGMSRQANLERSLLVARQIVQVLNGIRPDHLVNPQVWDHRRVE